MNALVEKGICRAVAAISGFPQIPIREATGSGIIPAENQLVIVQCTEVEHLVGPLHRATVKLILRTNVFDTVQRAHQDVSMLLLSLNPFEAESLFNEAAVPLRFGGLFIRSQSESFDEAAWLSTIEVLLGISSS